jgi:hypothetical protein
MGMLGTMEHLTIRFIIFPKESCYMESQYQKYDDEYLAGHYQKRTPDGRRFEDDNLTAYGLSEVDMNMNGME